MPISRPDAIPLLGEIIWSKNPRSILDIGVGFGIWGVLFRAWTDIRMAEIDPERYENWRTQIDGIEIHPDYVSKCWEVYDQVMVGNAFDILDASHLMYDHIHLGDVIEHMDKPQGVELLNLCLEHLNPGGSLTVVTPNGYRKQGMVLGNKFEQHKCGWDDSAFQRTGATQVWRAGNQLVAYFQG